MPRPTGLARHVQSGGIARIGLTAAAAAGPRHVRSIDYGFSRNMLGAKARIWLEADTAQVREPDTSELTKVDDAAQLRFDR